MIKLLVALLEGKPEIFLSIQGEGRNLGLPSVFIRLAACNLSCVWCDTPYTWDYKRFSSREMVILMSIQDTIKEIRKWNCRRLVITGGEPMLQQTQLFELMRKLWDDNDRWHYEVETNATVQIERHFDDWISEYNCSPKLANSGIPKEKRITQFFSQYARSEKSTLKFVIQNPEDLQEVLDLISEHKIEKRKVILMPEAITAEELAVKSRWLAEIAKDNGFRFSPRLHVYLWGNKGGV
jgi:organic radical activating enzyme